jgi:Stress responsive A/B Barrel Domain
VKFNFYRFSYFNYKNNTKILNKTHYLCTTNRTLFGNKEMNRRLVNYFIPALVFGAFLGTLFIWSMAIGPAPIKKQMVMCYKFKNNTAQSLIEKHMSDFKNLKTKSQEIVNYSAGYTSLENNQKPQYDVMHYLTFKTEEDIELFKTSQAFQNFVSHHQAN